MKTRETKNYEFKNCTPTDEFYKKAGEIINEMRNSRAPYTGELELEVSLEDAEVTTESKNSKGLSDIALRMFDELEKLATDIARKGKEPGKLKADIKVEKEL